LGAWWRLQDKQLYYPAWMEGEWEVTSGEQARPCRQHATRASVPYACAHTHIHTQTHAQHTHDTRERESERERERERGEREREREREKECVCVFV